MSDNLLNKVKKSLWLTPSIYSLMGLGLAVITTTIDTRDLEQTIYHIPDIFLTSVELAIEILSTLSSALLTMTTFTFSIIMVVLTTYSSQFSPRALPNFMTEKTTMRVLGVFLGTFIYSIYSLIFMRKSIEHEHVISAVIGVFITIICLVFFIHFIHYIGKSIQVDFLIEKLTKETLECSKSIKQHLDTGRLKLVQKQDVSYPVQRIVYCNQTKYLEMIKIEELIAFLAKHQMFIEVHHKIGEFITEDTRLLTMHRESGEINEDLVKKCLGFIQLSHKRSTIQDLSFAIQKKVEIALRATSPAINDPYTAKHAIRNVGRVLSEVSPLLEGNLLYSDQQQRARLLLPMDNLENLLYFCFYDFEVQSRKDLPVLGAILDALIMTARKSTEENKKVVWKFFNYLTYDLQEKDLHELDQNFIGIKAKQLFEATLPNQASGLSMEEGRSGLWS